MLGKEIAEETKNSKKHKREHGNLGDSFANKTMRMRSDMFWPIYKSQIKASYICRLNEQVYKRKKDKRTTAVLGFPFHEGLKLKGTGTHNSSIGCHNRPL